MLLLFLCMILLHPASFCNTWKLNVNMSTSNCRKVKSEKKKPSLHRFFPVLFLFFAAFFTGGAFYVTTGREGILGRASIGVAHDIRFKICETQNRPYGTEKLPKGIISATSDFEMQPLSGHKEKGSKKPKNLLAMAVGIKQKENVNKMVNKFLSGDFIVMLFHYDGNLDEWRDLEWNYRAIHVSAINQTKWWFAKRFLHPDTVAEYDYIFLWDEDLGVDNFNAERYLSIIKEEGLEISQPALDSNSSELHHPLTERQPRNKVHRWISKRIGRASCDRNSTGPPCTGFVEMMAPVFSKASWRCAWHMIQNDLVHAWGLDFQLGYCVQGDRTKNIGIVDSEYVVHYGLPTLGGSMANKEQSASNQSPGRITVRKWSFIELEIFKNRWKRAVRDDGCWTDPYQ